MPLQNLSQMKDEDYKKLTPEELMKYNRPMPELNYDKPYSHIEYPSMMYRPRPDGARRLQSIVCQDEKARAKLLKEGWKNTPGEWGIVTAPAAKPHLIDTDIEIPMEEDKK